MKRRKLIFSRPLLLGSRLRFSLFVVCLFQLLKCIYVLIHVCSRDICMCMLPSSAPVQQYLPKGSKYHYSTYEIGIWDPKPSNLVEVSVYTALKRIGELHQRLSLLNFVLHIRPHLLRICNSPALAVNPRSAPETPARVSPRASTPSRLNRF